MCSNCFINEILSFITEDEWLVIDLRISALLSQNKLKHVASDKTEETLYECQTCKNVWRLRDPDHADRGYLLTQEK